MTYHKRRGFTLIELLVVIAIIGILSSVVLASLNAARNKGKNAAIQANLSTIRTQAQLYYQNNNNSYGTFQYAGSNPRCPIGTTGQPVRMFNSDPIIKNAIIEADKAAGGSGDTSNPSGVWCSLSVTSGSVGYTVTATLASPINGNGYWCVDSESNSMPVVTGNCPGRARCTVSC